MIDDLAMAASQVRQVATPQLLAAARSRYGTTFDFDEGAAVSYAPKGAWLAGWVLFDEPISPELRTKARKRHGVAGQIEFDDDAFLSQAGDQTWVQGWFWLDRGRRNRREPRQAGRQAKRTIGEVIRQHWGSRSTTSMLAIARVMDQLRANGLTYEASRSLVSKVLGRDISPADFERVMYELDSYG